MIDWLGNKAFRLRLWLIRLLIGRLSVAAHIHTYSNGEVLMGEGMMYDSVFMDDSESLWPMSTYCEVVMAQPLARKHRMFMKGCVFFGRGDA